MIDHDVRNCDYVKVPEPLAETVDASIVGHMERYYNTATRPIPGQPTLIYRYMKGVGFDVHHDEVTDIEVCRAQQSGQPVIGGNVTALLFLNDPDKYVGGELYFEHPVELEVRPPSGTLVSFPATRDYLHGVRPIRAGERYSLLVRYTADLRSR
ncbi:MAG: 2OG-Fe(II) oxygenase [Actinophytocola sp.]|uniref:2OG-Fe(II) oxygenase n=1 Tax=Actinophytocola sp. TaxID=1872138 RepID=UPI003C73C2E8